MWDCSVFTQYSYYCDFFCLVPTLCFLNRHCHWWVSYINTTKNTVWCMSLLLLYIDIWWLCYFIILYVKLTNVAMIKWSMVKWCNGEIKIRIGCFVSHKYRICSFVLFPNTTFLQQKKQYTIFSFWSPTTSTATKFMLSTQLMTEIWGFIRNLTMVMMDIMTLI